MQYYTILYYIYLRRLYLSSDRTDIPVLHLDKRLRPDIDDGDNDVPGSAAPVKFLLDSKELIDPGNKYIYIR